MFQAGADGFAKNNASDASVETADTVLESVQNKRWYPESFQSMIQSKHIDPAKMSDQYRFDMGIENQDISIVLENTVLSWTYTSIAKNADGVYQFVGTPVSMKIRSADEIAVQYAGKDGKPKAQTFVALTENVALLVQEEVARRQKELEQLRLFGPSFVSSNYGRLQFLDGNGFSWTGYNLLVPTIIAQSAGNGGTVSVSYFISATLKNSYDGILTFRFEGMAKEANFLYKMTDDGLRLEDAGHAQIANGVVTSRGTSPLVIFFSHNTGN